VGRLPRLALTLLALAPLGAAAQSQNPSPTPLLDYARELPPPTQPFGNSWARRLASVEQEIARHPPPPQEECAHTLGAGRFADLYEQLGSVRANTGDHSGAIEAYEQAIACQPRVTYRYSYLAAELLHAGRLDEARATAGRARALDGEVSSLLGQIDVVEEHWADAVARFRTLAITEVDPQQAQYWQCFLWFSQRRAGVQSPELVERDAYEPWPTPILDALQGQVSESDVVGQIRQEGNETRQREKLVEALYYIGQARLAAGQPDLARTYFAAAVNLKVLYFIEPHLALAELAKMRAAREARTAEAAGRR
jgi:tetratricopeptide (TPR) repeat protein